MAPNENNGLKPMCKKKKDARMTFDPTQNRIPACLLTPEELEALKEWPHGHEVWLGKWVGTTPSWSQELVYRGKPAPVVESERRGGRIAELEAKLANTVEALRFWKASYETGRNEPLVQAFENAEATLAQLIGE